MTVVCQHCGFGAPAARTYCPECRRKLRRPDAVTAPTTPAPVSLAVQPVPAPAPPWANAGRPAERYPHAVVLSAGVAGLGVVGWVVLAETWHVRSALVALAVAAGVTAVFRREAPHDRRAVPTVVAMTLASAVFGLLASQYAVVARAAHVSFFTAVLNIPLSDVPKLFTAGITPVTWFIVALSVYSGYRFATRLPAAPPPPGRRSPALSGIVGVPGQFGSRDASQLTPDEHVRHLAHQLQTGEITPQQWQDEMAVYRS
jgi:hypothetical protein